MTNSITDVEILEAARALYQERYYRDMYVSWCEQCGNAASTHIMESGLVCRKCAQELLAFGELHND